MRIEDLGPLVQGNSPKYRVTVSDKNDSPIAIGGDKLYLTIKKDPTLPDSEADLQIEITVPVDADSEIGVAYIRPTPAQTAGIEPGEYSYDILWISTVSDPGGSETVQIGKLQVIQRVTHAIV